MSRFPLFALLSAMALFGSGLFSGCSAESRKARLLARADGFFAEQQYEKAEIEYKNVLQAHGLDPIAIARLGIIYFDQGRIGPASQFLTRAVELRPDDSTLRLKQGLCYVVIGKVDEARNIAAQLLQRGQIVDEAVMLLAEASQRPTDWSAARVQLAGLPVQDAAVLSALALLDLREGRAKEAEQLLSRALTLQPKFGPANSLMGILYFSRNELGPADKAYAAAAAASPARSPFRVQHAQFNARIGKVPEARRILEETIRGAADYVPARVLLANILLGEKQYDEGIVVVDKIIAQDGSNLEALLLSAQLRLAKGEKENAAITLESAARQFPRNPLPYFQLGTTYLASGDLAKAATSLAQAVSLAPDYYPAVMRLADLNIRQGNQALAVTALRRLLLKYPANVEALSLLATALLAQGNPTDALATYGRISAIEPKNSHAYLAAGRILMERGNLKEARTALLKATEHAPDDWSALEQLVNIDIFEKKTVEALARASEMTARFPRESRLYMLKARVLNAQGNFAGAEEQLRRAIELQPEVPEGYIALAQLLVATKQPQRAMDELRAATQKCPGDIRPFMMLAELHEERKDYASASKAYEQVLVINPKAAAAMNNLAYHYAEHLGELDKAVEVAQRARDLLPNQWETADTLGWILYKKRQLPRAVTLLEDAATKNPENAELQYHVGMANYLMGDEAKARAALARALQLGRNFSGADEAVQSLAFLEIDGSKADGSARGRLENAATKNQDDPVVQSRLGLIYEREGSRDKAMAAFELTLKASPAHVEATLGMVRSVHAKGESTKALEIAIAARKAAPGEPRFAHAAGTLALGLGDFATAALMLQDASRQLPADAGVLFDYAEAAYGVGRVADAQNALRDALQKSPDSPKAAKARDFLAMLALAEDAKLAAASSAKIDAALAASPNDVPALMAKGLLAEANRDSDSAKKIYELVLGRYRDFTPAKKRLAIIFAARGDDDRKAMELATKAREAFPDDAELARAFGIITYRLGNFSRAVSLLSEATRSRPDDAEVFFFLGMAQLKQKENAASVRSLTKALALGLPEKLAAEAKKALPPAK